MGANADFMGSKVPEGAYKTRQGGNTRSAVGARVGSALGGRVSAAQPRADAADGESRTVNKIVVKEFNVQALSKTKAIMTVRDFLEHGCTLRPTEQFTKQHIATLADKSTVAYPVEIVKVEAQVRVSMNCPAACMVNVCGPSGDHDSTSEDVVLEGFDTDNPVQKGQLIVPQESTHAYPLLYDPRSERDITQMQANAKMLKGAFAYFTAAEPTHGVSSTVTLKDVQDNCGSNHAYKFMENYVDKAAAGVLEEIKATKTDAGRVLQPGMFPTLRALADDAQREYDALIKAHTCSLDSLGLRFTPAIPQSAIDELDECYSKLLCPVSAAVKVTYRIIR